MKYLAANTENEAKALAHRLAFENGEHRQRLYPKGARFVGGVLELPDQAKVPARIQANIAATRELALTRKVERAKPIARKRPVRKTVVDRITGRGSQP